MTSSPLTPQNSPQSLTHKQIKEHANRTPEQIFSLCEKVFLSNKIGTPVRTVQDHIKKRLRSILGNKNIREEAFRAHQAFIESPRLNIVSSWFHTHSSIENILNTQEEVLSLYASFSPENITHAQMFLLAEIFRTQPQKSLQVFSDLFHHNSHPFFRILEDLNICLIDESIWYYTFILQEIIAYYAIELCSDVFSIHYQSTIPQFDAINFQQNSYDQEDSLSKITSLQYKIEELCQNTLNFFVRSKYKNIISFLTQTSIFFQKEISHNVSESHKIQKYIKILCHYFPEHYLHINTPEYIRCSDTVFLLRIKSAPFQRPQLDPYKFRYLSDNGDNTIEYTDYNFLDYVRDVFPEGNITAQKLAIFRSIFDSNLHKNIEKELQISLNDLPLWIQRKLFHSLLSTETQNFEQIQSFLKTYRQYAKNSPKKAIISLAGILDDYELLHEIEAFAKVSHTRKLTFEILEMHQKFLQKAQTISQDIFAIYIDSELQSYPTRKEIFRYLEQKAQKFLSIFVEHTHAQNNQNIYDRDYSKVTILLKKIIYQEYSEMQNTREALKVMSYEQLAKATSQGFRTLKHSPPLNTSNFFRHKLHKKAIELIKKKYPENDDILFTKQIANNPQMRCYFLQCTDALVAMVSKSFLHKNSSIVYFDWLVAQAMKVGIHFLKSVYRKHTSEKIYAAARPYGQAYECCIEEGFIGLGEVEKDRFTGNGYCKLYREPQFIHNNMQKSIYISKNYSSKKLDTIIKFLYQKQRINTLYVLQDTTNHKKIIAGIFNFDQISVSDSLKKDHPGMRLNNYIETLSSKNMVQTRHKIIEERYTHSKRSHSALVIFESSQMHEDQVLQLHKDLAIQKRLEKQLKTKIESQILR